MPTAVISLISRCLGTVTSTARQRQTSWFALWRTSVHATPCLLAVLAIRRSSSTRFIAASLS